MGEKTSGREGEWRREIKEEKEVKEREKRVRQKEKDIQERECMVEEEESFELRVKRKVKNKEQERNQKKVAEQ